MQTQSIVFTGPGQVQLVAGELPAPGEGQVTVRNDLTLISTGTELICLRGECDDDTHWKQYMRYPHHPGYSAVGTVVKLGEGVTDIKRGTRVCTTAGHVSHANVPVQSIWGREVPEALPDEEAVWAVLGVITQTGVRQAEHTMGDSAVVIGLGPLGQLVTRYLWALGLGEVLVIDPVQGRIDRALEHGATQGFCGDVAAARDFVLEHTEGIGADVVYDVTGHYAVLPLALPLARDFGKMVLLGDSPFPSRQHLTYDVLSRQVQIVGSRSCWLPPKHSHWTPQRQVDLLLSYLVRGQMAVSDLLTHVFQPAQCAEAYGLLLADRLSTLGVAFDWRRMG